MIFVITIIPDFYYRLIFDKNAYAFSVRENVDF